MGFEFKKPEPKRKRDEEGLTTHQIEYREREKREEERYKMAVDTRFWICFCFHDARERDEFAALADADAEGFCFGDRLHDVFAEKVGVNPMRQFKPKRPQGDVFPDPFADLEPSDDLEADCFAEAEALLNAFEANPVKERHDNVWDSPHHVVAIFRDSEMTDEFIRDFALAKFGDLYMDGSAILAHLKKGKTA